MTKGSTPYFIVAMVIFDCNSDAELTSKAIAELQKKLSVKPEFKFSRLKSNYRDTFFTHIKNYKFRIRALVVNKSLIYSNHLRQCKQPFYHYFVKNLLKYDNALLQNAVVKIDGSGDKVFKKALQAYMRKELPKGKIQDFKFVDSKKNSLIQLADMVAGAIARCYKDHRDYRSAGIICWKIISTIFGSLSKKSSMYPILVKYQKSTPYGADSGTKTR